MTGISTKTVSMLPVASEVSTVDVFVFQQDNITKQTTAGLLIERIQEGLDVPSTTFNAVSNINALKTYSVSAGLNGIAFLTRGASTENDDGQGLFFLTTSDPGTSDDTTIIQSNTSGYWFVKVGQEPYGMGLGATLAETQSAILNRPTTVPLYLRTLNETVLRVRGSTSAEWSFQNVGNDFRLAQTAAGVSGNLIFGSSGDSTVFRGGVSVNQNLMVDGTISNAVITAGSSALTVNGEVSVRNRVVVGGGLQVIGLSNLQGTAQITGGLSVSGNVSAASLNLSGQARIQQGVSIGGNVSIAGNINVGGNAKVDGNLVVSGDFNPVTLSVSGSAAIGSQLYVLGPTRLDGGVSVSGKSYFKNAKFDSVVTAGSDVYIQGDAFVSGRLVLGNVSVASLNVSGNVSISGKLYGNTANFDSTVSALNLYTTGNAFVNQTLTVTGVTKLDSTVSAGVDIYVNRDALVSGKVTSNSLLTVTASVAGKLYGTTANFDSSVSVLNIYATGNGFINQTLTVTGVTKLDSTVSAGVDLYVNRDVYVSGALRTGSLNVLGDATIGGAITASNGTLTSFTSLGSLRAFSPTQVNSLVYMKGYADQGDGGQGFFRLTNVNPGSDNGGTIFLLTVGTWWAVRQQMDANQAFDVQWFGVRGNGTTDDTARFTAAVSAATADNRIAWIPDGLSVFCSSTVVLPTGARIMSNPRAATVLGPSTSTGVTFQFSSNSYFKGFNVLGGDLYAFQHDSTRGTATSVTWDDVAIQRVTYGINTFGGSRYNSNFRIENSYFTSCVIGLNFETLNDSQINNNQFRKGTGANILFEAAKNNTIDSNYIEEGQTGIIFIPDFAENGYGNGAISNNHITNNTIKNPNEEAISFDLNGSSATGMNIRETTTVDAKSETATYYQLDLSAQGGSWTPAGTGFSGAYLMWISGSNVGGVHKSYFANSSGSFLFYKSPRSGMSSTAYAQVSVSAKCAIGIPFMNNVIDSNTIVIDVSANTTTNSQGNIALYNLCFYNHVTNNSHYITTNRPMLIPSGIYIRSSQGFQATPTYVTSTTPFCASPSYGNLVQGNTLHGTHVYADFRNYVSAVNTPKYTLYGNRFYNNTIDGGKLSVSAGAGYDTTDCVTGNVVWS